MADVSRPPRRLLTLMRHGRAMAGDPSNDHARALDERGRADVIAVATRTAVRVEPPELILCSDARRTLETAERVRETLGLGVDSLVHDGRLYLASLDTLLTVIDAHDRPELRHLMLIGHNPGLEGLARHLDASAPVGFSTATLCRYSRGSGALAAERDPERRIRQVLIARP